MSSRAALAIALAIAPLATAGAQCADGSPPPCKTAATGAAPQRKAPPLDDRTWIVVPFDNLNNSQDIDWLRAGSVNLLYLGMSRWTDLRVIDDERVADFMREVPGASEAKQLTLNTAIAVAKRAGAGRLVMGDLLKLGNKTTVNAKIFDVKTGQRIRTAREESSFADSLMPMFGKLSQKILNIAPPPGSSAGIVGTSSVSAYQSYAEGMQALNKFELEDAQRHFDRALQLDSTFALAHAKLAVLLGWLSPGLPSIQAHADAAGRLSAGLPPREKSLIDAQLAFSHGDYVKACNGFRGLLKRDSTDTDAWYGLGDCLYHDPAMEPVPGDSTRWRFRGNRNESIRAFRTALALDPTYHLAYQHIVDGYLAQSINSRNCGGQTCALSWNAVLRPSGDSMIIDAVALPRDSAAYRRQTEALIRDNGRRRGLEIALATSDRWLEANPNEQRAKLMRSATLLTLGRVFAADSAMRGVTYDSSNGGFNAVLGLFEVQLKMWRTKASFSMYDSLRAKSFTVRGGANPVFVGNLLSQVAPIYGQFNVFDSLVNLGNRGAPPSRMALSRSFIREWAGMPSDSNAALFSSTFNEVVAAGGSAAITRQLGPPLVLMWRSWLPSQWPKLDTTVKDVRTLGAVAIQRGDTATLRRSVMAIDSLSRALASALLPDSGLAIFAAEGYLALKDSAAALNAARRWLDDILPFTPLLVGQVTGNSQLFVPRAILLRADLAAALGFKAEARLWYQRYLDLWAKADAPAAPVLDRVRKALAGLAA
jgi:tetratricopeptide (TPR) repeat protein